jgi:hypothetical protein
VELYFPSSKKISTSVSKAMLTSANEPLTEKKKKITDGE